MGPVFLRAAVHRKADRPEAGNAPVYRAQPRDDVLCAHRLGAVHEYVALRHRLGICRHVRRRNELCWLRCFAAAQKLAAAAPDLPHRFVRTSALVRLSLERPVRHGAFRPPRRRDGEKGHLPCQRLPVPHPAAVAVHGVPCRFDEFAVHVCAILTPGGALHETNLHHPVLPAAGPGGIMPRRLRFLFRIVMNIPRIIPVRLLMPVSVIYGGKRTKSGGIILI